MSKTHLLVEKAFVYDRVEGPKDPEACEYDNRLGAWVLQNGRDFLVRSEDPEHERPKTKKMDQETGEDMKGA